MGYKDIRKELIYIETMCYNLVGVKCLYKKNFKNSDTTFPVFNSTFLVFCKSFKKVFSFILENGGLIGNFP